MLLQCRVVATYYEVFAISKDKQETSNCADLFGHKFIWAAAHPKITI